MRTHKYKIIYVQPIDMFPQTANVECVIRFKDIIENDFNNPAPEYDTQGNENVLKKNIIRSGIVDLDNLFNEGSNAANSNANYNFNNFGNNFGNNNFGGGFGTNDQNFDF